MTAAPEPAAAPGAAPSTRALWIMLLALSTGFALSQAYRTVAAMMATQLQREFGLTAQQLGVFAAMFHFSFGALQLLMGIGIDLHGVRRTVLAAFPLTIAGALLSAFAPSYPVAVFGQALIGIGCAPAFLVCTVFIARNFPTAQFASVSGLVLGLGGVGLLATGTPLAWVVQAGSWRTGFLVLAAGSALAWLVIFQMVGEPAPLPGRRGGGMAAGLRDAAALFAMPQTAGIVALGAVTYASFIALRGLWLGPMLIERFGFGLVASGNVALAVSVASLLGPPVFGRLDSRGGTAHRRRRIVAFSALLASLFALLAVVHNASAVVVLTVVIGFLTGFIVWQYADVRAAYPESLTGRAMAVFTMAMFLGVAVVQWLSGLVAGMAQDRHGDPYTAVLLAIAGLVFAGAVAFRILPAPLAAR
jgi:predicted MFS family arabinose efflux permease